MNAGMGLPQARPTEKSHFASAHERTAVRFSIAKKYRCWPIFVQFHNSIPAYSCFPVAAVGTSNGNHKMKTHTPPSETCRRPALTPIALRGPRGVRRPWAADRESRFTHHPRPSPRTRVLIASFSAVLFHSLDPRCVRASRLLLGRSAIRNRRNPMKTNGELPF
jgi:hypothetical protein